MFEREDQMQHCLSHVLDSVRSADVSLAWDLRVRAVISVARCEEFVDAKQAVSRRRLSCQR